MNRRLYRAVPLHREESWIDGTSIQDWIFSLHPRKDVHVLEEVKEPYRTKILYLVSVIRFGLVDRVGDNMHRIQKHGGRDHTYAPVMREVYAQTIRTPPQVDALARASAVLVLQVGDRQAER